MNRNDLCVLPIIVSIILGIVIGTLFFAGIIVADLITVPIAIGLIFATITLILLFVISALGIKKEAKECICDFGRCLGLGALVTIVSGFLALTVFASLVVGSILSALLIGIFGFALILDFLSFVSLLVCLIKTNCHGINSCCKFEKDYLE